MGLVSSLYRLTPPTESQETRRERDARLRRWLTRLVLQYGHDPVLDAIETYPVGSDFDPAKAWLKQALWTMHQR